MEIKLLQVVGYDVFYYVGSVVAGSDELSLRHIELALMSSDLRYAPRGSASVVCSDGEGACSAFVMDGSVWHGRCEAYAVGVDVGADGASERTGDDEE